MHWILVVLSIIYLLKRSAQLSLLSPNTKKRSLLARLVLSPALALLTQVFLLADSTFNSLAVDEIAAEHAACDCIIHYGHTTLCQVRKIPTYFVFPRVEAPAAAVCDAIQAFRGSQACQGKLLVVLLDLTVMHLRDEICARVEVGSPSQSCGVLP
jgi:diphthamide biosynthesis enzyme Dph1/Dph2-like protein